MNQAIAGDVRFFFASVLLGVIAALVYDLLRVFRRVWKQSLFFVSFQDFVFWFLLGLSGFLLIYRYNDGVLRFFVLLGIGTGALLYYETLGRVFVSLCLKVLWLFVFPLQKGLLFLQKKGKLIKRTGLQDGRQKHQGRKDALATEKRKKKDGS